MTRRPMPSAPDRDAPPPSFTHEPGQPGHADEGIPTVAQRSSSIQQVRNVEDVALPRLVLSVERERGVAVKGRSVVHEGETVRIGTHASNDLVITDPAVSRFHCRLAREGGAWRVRDTSSLNGTTLDGVRVHDAELGPGGTGTLSLGDSIVRVRVAATAGEKHVPLAAPGAAFGTLLGNSVVMRRLFALLERIAASDIHVLVQGESGTGKELVATEIVQRGARSEKPFVIVDCGAISPNLVESELFGHVRGAFTGADRDRVGAFEAADGGTVFLDEIGELPVALQPKLLRALEAREIRRVGETRARKVDVRVVSATNRDLEREVNRGRFREDLYFRLAVVSVQVPPLRERVDDLELLVLNFLTQMGKPDARALFTPAVLAEMAKHDWPGNVRELRNYVERSVVLHGAQAAPASGPPLAASTRSNVDAPSVRGAARSFDARLPYRLAKEAVVDEFERTYVAGLLEASDGNLSKAARTAGMDRMYLHRLVQKHGLR